MARRVNPDEHAARRRQLCWTAARLFATQGYDGTSTAQIAREAGTSTGNLFHYFASKKQILVAVLTMDPPDRAAMKASALAKPPLDGLVDFVVQDMAGDASTEHVPALVLEAIVQATRDPELAEVLDQDTRAEVAVLDELVARAELAGVIDPSLEHAHVVRWLRAFSTTMYLQAALEQDFDPRIEEPLLRRTILRFLAPQ